MLDIRMENSCNQRSEYPPVPFHLPDSSCVTVPRASGPGRSCGSSFSRETVCHMMGIVFWCRTGSRTYRQVAVYSHRRDKSRTVGEELGVVEPALLLVALPVRKESVRSEADEHALLLEIVAPTLK